MYSAIIRRVGLVLLAVGLIDMTVTIIRWSVAGPYPAGLDIIAIAAGIFLLTGGPRAALWVRTLAAFVLAAGAVMMVAAPFNQPLDLTVTEIRLRTDQFAAIVAPALLALLLLLWVVMDLGRPPVDDALDEASITRWPMRLPAQLGGGVAGLICLMVWFSLHGETAELATSLARQQMGYGVRYHLSWISSTGSGHGSSIRGTVIAWNHNEIREILLHWETR